ncbi:MAG TPA: Do family serine endopeptidase [Caulobacteraceae bacterium]|jgi:serine protease Do|nr:Do family serine endopeptidase [Caulobacteraceae bacterium]
MMLKNKTFIAGVIAGAGVACAALAGAGLQWPVAAAQESQSAQLVKAAVVAPPPGAPITFADIVDKVSPAVVSIETRSKVNAEALRKIPGFENFPYNQPGQPGQGGQGGQGGGNDESQDAPEQFGAGSGFFISPDGYIVTNNHVVEGADEITVKLQDNTELKAKVIGRDAATDLAVVKVEGHDFKYVDFESSAKPRVGDWVIAIGNPFTLGGTVTAGIVSAYSRDIGEAYVDYIQIDAPINRGNSGGPTFDIYGRVIGVNTAIYSPNGAYAGIGFAIPADVASSITKELIANGKIARGYLGVTISSITDDMAASLNLPNHAGAYVTEVVPGGPSDRAGVKVGDIVTKLNGQPVKDNTELTRRVALARVGEVLHLDVLRAGKPLSLEVKSGVRPSEEELAARDSGGATTKPSPAVPPAAAPDVLGLNVSPVDAAARQRYSLGSGATGVVITGTVPHTEAAKKGFRPGDVVVMADGHSISGVADFAADVSAVKASGRPSVLLLVQRDGRNIPVTIPFEKPAAK